MAAMAAAQQVRRTKSNASSHSSRAARSRSSFFLAVIVALALFLMLVKDAGNLRGSRVKDAGLVLLAKGREAERPVRTQPWRDRWLAPDGVTYRREKVPVVFVDAPYSPLLHTFNQWRGQWKNTKKPFPCDNECIFTKNASLVDSADVVVWGIAHNRDILQGPNIPLYKPPFQKWIVTTFFEAPRNMNPWSTKDPKNAERKPIVQRIYERLSGRVDYVQSYRLDDTDFVDRLSFMIPSPTKEPINNSGGDLLVTWFVSNCGGNKDKYNAEEYPEPWLYPEITALKRLRYARKMLEEMSKQEKERTDFYGGCFGSKDTGCGDRKHEDRKCMADLMRRYKFYLAFENTECSYYITEKIERPYRYGMVPIAMGGLCGRADYERAGFLPKSFIHVDDFGSPKELVDHLRYLDKNKTAYLEYFDWQKTHRISYNTGIPQVREQMCLVCAAAHGKGEKEGVPARRPKSFNLYDWRFKDTCRKTGWLPPYE